MSTYGRSKIQCLYVAGIMTECPLRRGVHLWEMSISRGLTVGGCKDQVHLLAGGSKESQLRQTDHKRQNHSVSAHFEGADEAK